jgi:hypothetical protein
MAMDIDPSLSIDPALAPGLWSDEESSQDPLSDPDIQDLQEQIPRSKRKVPTLTHPNPPE